MAFIKTLTIDDFYTPEGAYNLSLVAKSLSFVQKELGRELENYNHVPDDISEIISNTIARKVEVDMDNSGVFRFPDVFVHFEPFNTIDDWILVVALDHTYFNIYEHKDGARNALEEYQFPYRDLFQWNVKVNYELEPGQAVFFRPWLFHSFTGNLVQIFRLRDVKCP